MLIRDNVYYVMLGSIHMTNHHIAISKFLALFYNMLDLTILQLVHIGHPCTIEMPIQETPFLRVGHWEIILV